MNKKKLQLGLVFLILFVAYAVVLFILNKNYKMSFWLSFAFIVAAFLLLMLAFFFVSSENRRRQVVGMPVTVLSALYMAIEFVLGTVLMCFPSLEFAAVFVPQFLLLCLFLLCFVPAMLSDNNYKKQAQSQTSQPAEVKTESVSEQTNTDSESENSNQN